MAEPVTVSTTIHAPASRVLEVVSDLENTDRWANEAKAARIQDKDDRGRPIRIAVTLGAVGFTSTATYDVTYTDTSLTLTCVAGRLIKESTITYTAHEQGGDTTLEMASTMEVTVPGIPRWGLERAMRSSAQKNLASVKADAERS